MNKMHIKPKNLTRVLVSFKESNILEFAFYKDGMYRINDNWYDPYMFNWWMSTNELKELIKEKESD